MRMLPRWKARWETRKPHQTRWSLWWVFVASCGLLACGLWLAPAVTKVISSAPVSLAHSTTITHGQGAGGTGSAVEQARTPGAASSFCLPTDVTCVINNIAEGIASQIQGVFQPFVSLLQNPVDIVYQTPAADSYQHPAILSLNALFITVVDLALACLLLIGAYNAMVGRHFNLPNASLGELFPRAVLIVCAVQFNQVFLGLFIDFANALSLAVIQVAGLHMLSNVIASILLSPFPNLLNFLLVFVLGIMVILLLIQMVVRLALVGLCIALAPLGLGCLLLPQTTRWGRLWLTTFSSAVLVQVFQVTALGLGGMFLTGVGATFFLQLDHGIATALLAIGTLFLVLKIPGMLQSWALQPMLQAGSGGGSGGSGSGTGAETYQAGSGAGSGGSSGGSTSGGSAGSSGAGASMAEGTIVTEESGALLLLF